MSQMQVTWDLELKAKEAMSWLQERTIDGSRLTVADVGYILKLAKRDRNREFTMSEGFANEIINFADRHGWNGGK